MATSGSSGGLSELGGAAGNLIGIPFKMFGSDSANRYLDRGVDNLNKGYRQAQDTLGRGRSQLNEIYSPYYNAGAAGLQKTGQYLDSMGQPANPMASNFNSDSMNPYLKKMTKYGMDQSNQGINASALAKGGVGGGLAKAISNNSMKYAGEYLKQANDMAMGGAKMNFDQGQQIYDNNQAWLQNQLKNNMLFANLGLEGIKSGTTANQLYDTGLANNYVGFGQDAASIMGAKAAQKKDLFSNIGDTVGQVAGIGGRYLTGAI